MCTKYGCDPAISFCTEETLCLIWIILYLRSFINFKYLFVITKYQARFKLHLLFKIYQITKFFSIKKIFY